MACPLFIPGSPLGQPAAVAAPLGDLYAGQCGADMSADVPMETVRRWCNFGYARGHCERATLSEADAVRLMVRSERGGMVEIAWSLERDHHPVAVGRMEIELANDPAPEGDPLRRQACACAAAFIRQGRANSSDRILVAGHP